MVKERPTTIYEEEKEVIGMGKGSSGHKENAAAKRNRAIYKSEGRLEKNKIRKAKKEEKKTRKRKAKKEAVTWRL